MGKSGVALVFEVNKGEKITITKLNFIGAKKLSKSDIEKDLANKEEDFLGWMPWRNSGEASIEQLEFDGFRAKNSYMEHGYLDAKVSDPLMRVDFGSYKAQIDYKVEEGEQYRIDNVEVSHTIKEIKTSKLTSLLRLKKGKIFNVKLMRKDMETIKEEVGNFGYAFVKVAPNMHQNHEEHTVNIQYMIREGEKVTINDVIISGNDSTKDRVIRRYLYLAPGDLFNARDLKDSKGALGRTGFFEKIDIQSQRVSSNKINLLVKVKETATGSISLGGGYSSFQGVMLNASYGEKNTFGSGITTNLGFEISKISKNYNLAFTNPKVWDSKYSLGVNFYKKNYEYYNFTQDQLGGSLSIGREFWRYFHASMGVGYVNNQSERNNDNIIGADGNVSFIDSFGLYNDKYSKSSLFASFSFDNTDDFYVPRNGMLSAINLEYASLKGDDFNATIGSGQENGYGDYFKITGKYGIYYGMEDWIDYDLIFRFKARGTFIFNGKNEKLPIGEKLFMGGAGSIRGYDPYSLSPTLSNDSSFGFGLGGKKRTSFSLEASVPLSESAKMRLTGFYDYGFIGEDNLNEVQRSSTGVVLEWQSAFGPINLIFAKALDAKSSDRTAIFEFSMGSKF